MSEPTTEFTQFHAFERDLLFAVCALERDGDPPRGLAIKEYLEAEYDDEKHSQLYQNLNGLVDDGLLAKGQQNQGTDEYATTETARDLLETRAKQRVEQVGLEIETDVKQSNETCSKPTASHVPGSENVAVLFNGEEMDIDEMAEDRGAWTYETDLGHVQVTFKWNDDFYTHASALVGPNEELVPLDFASSYTPEIDPVFVPTEEQYNFEVEVVPDDDSSVDEKSE